MHDRPDMPPIDFGHEAQVYAAIAGGPGGVGVPRLHWHGRSCEYDVLATDLLGPSLEDLFTYCGRRLSLKTVLMIADQAISRLQGIHAKGYVHRDVKPDNFLMGVGKSGNTLYVIDFGLARKWERAAALHAMDLPPVPFRGTAEFGSLNSHLGRGKFLPLTHFSLLPSHAFYLCRGLRRLTRGQSSPGVTTSSPSATSSSPSSAGASPGTGTPTSPRTSWSGAPRR